MQRASFYNPVNAAIMQLNADLNRMADRRMKMEMYLDQMKYNTRKMETEANDPISKLRRLQAERQMQRVSLSISNFLPSNPGDTKQEDKFKGFRPAIKQILGDNVDVDARGNIIDANTKQPYTPMRFEANEDMALLNIAGFHYFRDPRNVLRREIDNLTNTVKSLSDKPRKTVADNLLLKESKMELKRKQGIWKDPNEMLKMVDQSLTMQRDMMLSNSYILQNPRASKLMQFMYDKDSETLQSLIKQTGKISDAYDSKWFYKQEAEAFDPKTGAKIPGHNYMVTFSKHPAGKNPDRWVGPGGLSYRIAQTPKDTSGGAANARAVDSLVMSKVARQTKLKGWIDTLSFAKEQAENFEVFLADMKENNPELYKLVKDRDPSAVIKEMKTEWEGIDRVLKGPKYRATYKKMRPEAFKSEAPKMTPAMKLKRDKIKKILEGAGRVSTEEAIDTFLKLNPDFE